MTIGGESMRRLKSTSAATGLCTLEGTLPSPPTPSQHELNALKPVGLRPRLLLVIGMRGPVGRHLPLLPPPRISEHPSARLAAQDEGSADVAPAIGGELGCGLAAVVPSRSRPRVRGFFSGRRPMMSSAVYYPVLRHSFFALRNFGHFGVLS
eukprot:8313827-Pyramimonas_sp.AAC.1